MTEKKCYAATAEFLLTLNNGEETVNVVPGDVVIFDGLKVECKGKTGVAKPFSSIIREGAWVKQVSEDKAAELSQKAAIIQERKLAEIEAANTPKSRNATGDKILENSDAASDPYAPKKNMDKDYAELQSLVEDYEKETFEGKTKVISSDDEIVAEVSEAAKRASTSNSSGVEIDDQPKHKRTVVSHEQTVAKETHYNDPLESDTKKRKKLEVESDGDGVVVKKVSTPAINKNEIDKDTKIREKSEVSYEEGVVKETSYDEQKHTDVGSSTQAQTVQNPTKSSSKKASTEGTSKKSKSLDQEAVVVGKVRKTSSTKTEGGITSEVSVGSNEGSDGEAEFSSSGDGVDVGEVQVGSGSTPVKDISTDDDGGIDIEELLSN